MMTLTISVLFFGILLVLGQVLAALPWLTVAILNVEALRGWARKPMNREKTLQIAAGAGILLFAGLVLGVLLDFVKDKNELEKWGRLYGAVLHLSLLFDVFVGVFAILLNLWPKGGAVALAAFREGLRQPLFWLLVVIALALLIIAPFIPYFTFGEDLVMVKELGYDTVMLFAIVFGVLAASMSVTEEIEGRTAITLMSKPISRRQFLLGKFVGILLASAIMMGLLGWWFSWMVIYKHWYDRMDPVPTPATVNRVVDALYSPGEAADFLRGIGLWATTMVENTPGLILGFCQVMVLLAGAVALATRLPMVVNMVICLLMFFLGHLSPVLSEIANRRLDTDPNAAGNQMLAFMATLFNNVLPGMEFFSVGPALVTDSPPELGAFYGYVGMVTVYGLLYTLILLLVGLVLFEDRDLA